MFRFHHLFISAIFISPLQAQDHLRLTIEPEIGTIDQLFTFTLTNRDTEDFHYFDCCPFPEITLFAYQRELPVCIECDPCPPEPILNGVLRAGESLQHEWRPEDASCLGWLPVPGIYEVHWYGFPDAVTGRFELLPDPGRELKITALPHEARFGEPIHITMENTSSKSINYDACCYPPMMILDSRGRLVFCPAPFCEACTEPTELEPGGSLTFDWTPGQFVCYSAQSLPGRYRIIWGVFSAGSTAEGYFGETSVLVLPPEDRSIELEISPTKVHAGEILRITATNTLPVSAWYQEDPHNCQYPILIDGLGRESPCWDCDGPPRDVQPIEILPGERVSTEIRINPEDCLQTPGQWSLIMGNFWIEDAWHSPVYGIVEFTVLPPGEENYFRRGDVDGSGEMDLTDVIGFLNYQFIGSVKFLVCTDAADIDDDGDLSLNDAILSLSYQYLGTASVPEPPGPFQCGPDVNADAFPPCEYPPESCE